MLTVLPMWARLAFVAAVLAVAALGGWHLRAVKADADEAAMRLASANATLKAYAEKQAIASQLASQSKTALDALGRKQSEIDTLRSHLRDGSLVVRVRGADCVPGTLPAGRVDPSAGAVLTPAAGQDVLDLRAGVERLEGKLAACQTGAKTLTGQ